MTDNEIVKALECCVNGEDCLNCPLQEQFADCKPMTGALDLINRQKAEIERLNSPYEMQVEASKKLENSIKAEAVKECIEKIKSKAAKCVMTDNGIPVAGSASYSISEVELYKIEKEMVGAESGSIL